MPNKTITQVSVTAGEIIQLLIRRDPDTSNDLECIVTYNVLTNTAQKIGLNRSIKIPLTSGQQTTLQNFVLNQVVPAINTVEGT